MDGNKLIVIYSLFIIFIFILYTTIHSLLCSEGDKIKYTKSLHYNLKSFPIQLCIIDEGRRLSFDAFELSRVAMLVNRQFGNPLFKTDVLVLKTELTRLQVAQRFAKSGGSCINIYFELMSHRRPGHRNFDGEYGVLAHSLINGNELCFDFAEPWTRQMFFTTALHELMHSLGLYHSTRSDSIMLPTLKKQYELGSSDLENLHTLFPFFNQDSGLYSG